MQIAVLGTGTVGRTLGARFAELGHDVVLGTRDPAATRARDGWAEVPGVGLETFAAASEGAELVVHAGSGAAALDLLTAAGDLGGKVLVDVSNPLDFSAGFPPTLSVKDTDSLGEQVQRAPLWIRLMGTLGTAEFNLKVVRSS